MDWKQEKELKIFKGQCLKLAADSLIAGNIPIMANLDELFDRAGKIYAAGKKAKYPEKI